MEKSKPAIKEITTSFKKLDLNPHRPDPIPDYPTARSKLSGLGQERNNKPRSLVSLCLGVIGKHLEDLVTELGDIAAGFPVHIKMAIVAIARRRKLLDDDVLVSLADSSWEILDVSGSDVSDSGLVRIASLCKSLRAVDISRCDKITGAGVSELVQHCRELETLRCGGCPRSDHTARSCLAVLKPKLKDLEGDSWEELDTAEIGHSAESLRWLVWPKIDKDSLEILSRECPRIKVNPKPTLFGFRGVKVTTEALPDIALDDPVVKDINPETWGVQCYIPKPPSYLSSSNELSSAEKFRLAFEERDSRLAPKRAKNARQHQRRAEREWMMMSAEGKAIVLASKVSRSLHNRS